MNTKIKKTLKIPFLLLVLLGVLLGGGWLTIALVFNSLTSVYEATSPAKVGSAVFYREAGWLDTTTDLLIRDYALSGNSLIAVGSVGDRGGQGDLPEAVWSRDGSVLAIRRDVNNGGSDVTLWADVYDFRKHSRWIAEDRTVERKAQAIEKLLKTRGGQGQKIDLNWKKFRCPWLWESYR